MRKRDLFLYKMCVLPNFHLVATLLLSTCAVDILHHVKVFLIYTYVLKFFADYFLISMVMVAQFITMSPT